MPRAHTICVLKKRSEYLAVASHRKKWVTPAFIVQVAPRPVSDSPLQNPESQGCEIGLGLTTSKKMVGIAVERNRARRRLRALAREVMEAHAMPHYNYVLLARKDALHHGFDALRRDLIWALKRLERWRES